tara:strand:+ start:1668 stop:1943 length:276 start_codon:yes stop_codon:yes gene_type:complete
MGRLGDAVIIGAHGMVALPEPKLQVTAADRIQTRQIGGGWPEATMIEGGQQIQLAVVGQIQRQVAGRTVAKGLIQPGGETMTGPAALASGQ